MWAIVRTDLLSFLRSRRAVVWVGLLQLGLLLFILSIWPDENIPLPPDFIARTVIYDFTEKLLLLLLFIAPIITVSAFARERQRNTLHLLVASNTKPTEIVLGKAVSSLLYLFILLVASLPALVLILQVGGVPMKSIVLLYAFLAVTLVYTGLIGLYSSLISSNTAKALGLALVAIIALNWIFPSFQLYTGIIRDYFRNPGGFAAGSYLDLFPEPEHLYSTPEAGYTHYYVVDLFSPFSVYCNFRHVQLMPLKPIPSTYAGNPRPAGDFTMMYHYFFVAGIVSMALLLGCIRRLNAMTNPTERARKGTLTQLQGNLVSGTRAQVYSLGLLMAIILRCTIDLFDPSPPGRALIAMMLVVAYMAGFAATKVVANERERHTLKLLITSPLSTLQLFQRAMAPTFLRIFYLGLGFILGMWLIGEIIPFFYSAQYMEHYSPRMRGTILLLQKFEPLTFGELIRMAGSLAATAFFATGVGILCSVRCRSLSLARVATMLVMFAAWLMRSVDITTAETYRNVNNSELRGSLLGSLVGIIALLKDGLLFVVNLVNPFQAIQFDGRASAVNPFAEGLAWYAGFPAIFFSMLAGVILLQAARMQLINEDHFIE